MSSFYVKTIKSKYEKPSVEQNVENRAGIHLSLAYEHSLKQWKHLKVVHFESNAIQF